MTPGRLLRVVLVGTRTEFTVATRSRVWILFNLITPLAYAMVAFYLFRGDHDAETLGEVSIGTGLMGVSNAVLFSCGTAIQDRRWVGLLEPTLVCPTPFVVTLVPVAASSAFVGLYAMAATVGCGWLFFGVVPALGNPALFGAALVVCVGAYAMTGLLMAAVFVLIRNANALVNSLDHLLWLLTGIIVPVSLLPVWLHPLSWLLPPTWGAALLTHVASSQSPAAPLVGAVGVSLGYLVLSVLTLRHVERRARAAGTLGLA